MYIAISDPNQKTNLEKKQRKPAKFPAPIGETEIYINAIRPNCPVESVVILGLNFDKSVYPTAASEPKNEGKHFPPGYIARKLAKNQADAILARAKETFIYDAQTNEFCAADYLICVPARGFNPIDYASQENEEKHNQIVEEMSRAEKAEKEESKKDVYEQQSQPERRKK